MSSKLYHPCRRDMRILAGLCLALLGMLLSQRPAVAGENVHFLDPSKGEHLKAQNRLTRSLKEKEDAHALTELGWVRLLYFADGTRARTCFKKAIALKPSLRQAWLGLGLVHLSLGMNDDARQTFLTFVEQFPDAPESEVLLTARTDFGSVSPPLYRDAKAWVRRMLDASPANAFVAGELRRRWAGFLRGEERFDEAFALWQAAGNIPCWYVIGRFGPEGAAWFDEPLPPEKEINLDRTYPVDLETLTWRPVRFTPTQTSTPKGFHRALRGRGAVSYYLTFVQAKDITPAALQISGGTSCRVWLNGVAVGVVDRFRQKLAASVALPFTLGKGWNALLLKVVSSSGGRYGYGGSQGLWGYRQGPRLTAPDGTDLSKLTFSCEFDQKTLPPIQEKGCEKDAKPVSGGALAHFLKAASGETCTVSDLLLLTALYRAHGLEDKAFEVTERLYKAHQGWAMALHLMASAYRRAPHYPWDLKRQKERALTEAAVALDPSFLPARLDLLEQKGNKNAEKVLDELRELAVLHKNSFLVQGRLANVYDQLGWKADRYAQLKAMTERWPEDPRTCALWRGYYDLAGNTQKSIEWAKKAIALEGAPSKQSLSRYWERMDRLDLFLPLLQEQARRNPDDMWTRKRIAGYMIKTGEVDGAIEMLKEIRRLDPEENSVLKTLAEAYALKGDEKQSRTMLEEIQSLPAKYGLYDNRTRRYLHFLREREHENWETLYAVDVDSIIRQAPGSKDYPDVASVILFEQHVIRFFGKDLKGAEQHIEQVVKIFNKAGGEKYGRLASQGRLREARVHTPDGRVLEPDPVQEGWNLALPKLDKGSILHVRYVSDRRVGRPTTGVRAIGRSPDIRRRGEPVCRLRMVAILPDGAEYRFRIKNLDVEPVRKKVGSDIHVIWDLLDVKEVVRESFTPSQWEILPQIRILSGHPVLDRVDREMRSEAMNTCVPGIIQREAARLIEGETDRLKQVRRLYRFCVEKIRYGWNRDPCHTLIKKEGQAQGLFKALVRGAGIPIVVARYTQRNPRGVDWDLSGPSRFQGEIFYIPLDKGEGLWLSPGRYVPWKCLPAGAYGAPALLVSREGCRLTEVPTAPFERSVPRLEATLTLHPDRSASVEGEAMIPGFEAGNFRTMLERYATKAQAKMFISMFLNNIFRGMAVDTFELFGDFKLDDGFGRMTFKGKVPMFASQSGGGLLVKPVVRKLKLSRTFIRETERRFPLRLRADGGSQGGVQLSNTRSLDRLRFRFPKGARWTRPRSVFLVGEFGEYGLSCRIEKGELVVERNFRLYDKDVPKDRYSAFQRFCKQIDEWEEESLILNFGKK